LADHLSLLSGFRPQFAAALRDVEEFKLAAAQHIIRNI